MGMYTAFGLRVRLKKSMPTDVVASLEWMTTPDQKSGPLPSYLPSWITEDNRGRHLLFSAGAVCDVVHHPAFSYDVSMRSYTLTATGSIKNYYSEIDHFCEWITPYLDTGYGPSFLGWKHYEEADYPSLWMLTYEGPKWFTPALSDPRYGDPYPGEIRYS